MLKKKRDTRVSNVFFIGVYFSRKGAKAQRYFISCKAAKTQKDFLIEREPFFVFI